MPEILRREIQIDLEERKEGASQTTFGAVLSTESPVARSNGFETFNEVLRHSKDAIDLSRSPLPLIISHDQRTLPVGVIENIRLDGHKLRGTVRFGQSQRAQEVARDVADGIIRGVSIGYSIERYEEKETRGTLTRTATRWTPHEASAVAIPADIQAGFGRTGAQPMADTQTTTNETTETTERSGGEPREHLQTRAQEIRTACHHVQIRDEFADQLIDSGASIDQAREKIFAELARRSMASNTPRGTVNPEASAFRIDGAHDNLRDNRDSIVREVVTGHLGSLELARMCLSSAGQRIPANNQKLIARSMQATSDFPSVLDAAVGTSLRVGFENEPASHRQWVRIEEVPDFNEQKRPVLGAAPDLEQVGEGGEYEHGSLDEDTTSYKVAKYGRIVSLSWEILVNDRLGAFLRTIPAMGQAAKRKEADTLYELFAENAGAGPTMQDGQVLFHSDHANLTSSGTFNAALLAAARTLLRKQTTVGGGYLALQPHGLIVPAELEHDAELLLAAATRIVSTTQEAETPKWLSGLVLVVEPRLAANAAYLTADPNQADSVVLGILSENMSGPYTETKDDFERDRRLMKVRHVFGAKATDHRGIVKMPVS